MSNNINKNQNEDTLEWEEISTEHIVQDEWIDFRRSTYRFPDGRVFEPFYSYSRRDFCVIVATDADGNYICVRQFRQGIGRVTTEFPAGGIERNDGKEYDSSRFHAEKAGASEGHEQAGSNIKAEDALEAAKRELSEETGYESDEWEHLLTVPSNATIADNYAHLFVAKNCRQVSGQSLDETEYLRVVKHTPDEIEELIKNGEFAQAIHITAWLMSQR